MLSSKPCCLKAFIMEHNYYDDQSTEIISKIKELAQEQTNFKTIKISASYRSTIAQLSTEDIEEISSLMSQSKYLQKLKYQYNEFKWGGDIEY